MKKFVTFLIIAAIAAGSLTGCGEKTLGDELPNDSESAAGVAYSSDNSEPEAAPVESETAPAEEETDPLELANEIIAGLRDDLKICSDLANYNCEVSGGIDGVEVQRRDGSTTTVTLAMIAPPYDTLDSWLAQMHKVFTDEHCNALKEDLFGIFGSGWYHEYEGKIGFEAADGVQSWISIPFASAEFISDTEIIAKTTIPDDYDINFYLRDAVTFKKENGEWKIDRLITYDGDREKDAHYAYVINAEDIPPYEE